MAITVDHNYFESTDTVRKELESLKLWTHEFEAPGSGGTPLHWHDVGMHIYITNGKFRFRDPATDTLHECTSGTRFIIPERTLHIEEAHTGYAAIVGFSKEEIPQPFVRSPDEL